MTAQELRTIQRLTQRAQANARRYEQTRDEKIRAALSTGWSQANIAETTGLTRGRIHQIAHAPTEERE